MKYYIIIPAHNEEACISLTLESVILQTLPPKKVVVVNDHSNDSTPEIVEAFAQSVPYIELLNTTSDKSHMPGSKVINAFNKGMKALDDNFDFIVKLDADIVLPKHYFQTISKIFTEYPKAGIAGGFAYEQDSQGNWHLNHPMSKTHVRGAFKSYSKNCLEAIGGLKNAMGWDTVDELLAQYHGFQVITDESLQVKHLRPTGTSYNRKARLLQGQAMYTMRYGLLITLIASLKMALKSKRPKVLFDNLQGYFQASSRGETFLVSSEEGEFIRGLRWKNIKSKLTN
ncbi:MULTISPECIES: glycosyltransferase [Maribacter]|uniref:Glycosyltransferase family 2 protein n=1 Tax=Maribacter flavus TaxID=1658664 RepID=A0ABU7IH05_9FLAO|nr:MULTISPECIES: glycosyltransferase family 2 protein [Maribacter]MDC6404808.1 glycosyltransferase family 2 protein [Maribacter sp. PR66]MEE1972222.1 glycosyltransferase family 2 protein [Maribacter flavus]